MQPKLEWSETRLETLARDCTAFQIRSARQRVQRSQSCIEITNADLRNNLAFARIPAASLGEFREEFASVFFGLLESYVAVTMGTYSGRVAPSLVDRTSLTFPNRSNEGACRYERIDTLYAAVIGRFPVMVELGIVGKNTEHINRVIYPRKRSDYNVGVDITLFTREGSEEQLVERVSRALFPVIERYVVAGADKYRK